MCTSGSGGAAGSGDAPADPRVIDLERSRVIDLLPDRLAETAAAWMQQQPTIELVSRDRGGDYAAAARKGAPQAIQVADRFHVMHNLTEAVGAALVRCWAEQGQKRQRKPSPDSAATDDTSALLEGHSERFRRSRTQERVHQAHQALRDAEYAQMLALRAQGLSFKAIAKQMGKGGATPCRAKSTDDEQVKSFHQKVVRHCW